ncbi:unnamed protein product [Didymodactylos carnosus]|uniref:Uncharacterized protein n=1 Tax=Didymodactylos carnosus TaxID=1234261 RepID=A0A8S2ENV1_9BILA|nr:unnamed protein product [Didymodactylos carnosus]CAF4041947.1 unnamed protein product [Didymodactylos carnosus]
MIIRSYCRFLSIGLMIATFLAYTVVTRNRLYSHSDVKNNNSYVEQMKSKNLNSHTQKHNSKVSNIYLRDIINLEPLRLILNTTGLLYQFTNSTIRTKSKQAIDFPYTYHNNSDLNKSIGLIIMIHGYRRLGDEWFTLSGGRRIVRSFLAAAMDKRNPPTSFDLNWPLKNQTTNTDVLNVLVAFHTWLKQHYRDDNNPNLFLYAVSSGCKFATILSRALPIIAQVLLVGIGSVEAITTPLTRRFSANLSQSLAPVFTQSNLFPVPPTLFNYALHDKNIVIGQILPQVQLMRQNSFELGGFLLTYNESIHILVIHPSELGALTLQEKLDEWQFKPYLSRLFYQISTSDYYRSSNYYATSNSTIKGKTFWCTTGDIIDAVRQFIDVKNVPKARRIIVAIDIMTTRGIEEYDDGTIWERRTRQSCIWANVSSIIREM